MSTSKRTNNLIKMVSGLLAILMIMISFTDVAYAKTVTLKASAAGTTPTINVTRSTTDDTGAVVGITVKGSGSSDSTSETKTTVNVAASSISGSVAGIPYSKLAMANVQEAVNVRADANENSTLMGKLYSGCGGEIIEQTSTWTKIKTGNLVGWVRNDFLKFGEEAKKLADSSVSKTATSIADTLRVRMEPSENAGVYTLLARGDEIDAVSEDGEWVKVEFADGTEGYVAAQYVTISDELGKGETLEEISKRELREKAEKEAAEKEAAAATATTDAAATAATATTDAAAAATTATAATDGGLVATNNGAIAGDVNDVRLLAALIQCEAGGEIYEGQVSVGTVVMNRLRSGRYGDSIYSVIYAKSQFSPAGTGQVAQVYAAGPKSSCVMAAQEAMSGTSYVGNATKFRNVRSGYQGIVIGNHVFW